MTSTNPTEQEIDALILGKVKEVVSEIVSLMVDYGTVTVIGRSIQFHDILSTLEKNKSKPKNAHTITVDTRGVITSKMFKGQKRTRSTFTIHWNLSLDYAHQSYETKLGIYQLMK